MEIKIGKRKIGKGHPVFVVAEMSGNHNHSFRKALKIIDAAAAAGADAIKLQTYTPDTLTIKSDKKWFRIGGKGLWSGHTLYGLYSQSYTPWEWQAKLKKYAEKKGLIFFSAPFDETAVDFLEKMRVPAYKVASFEVGDLELLRRLGRTGKPVIVSRGMATMPEIKLALKILQSAGTKQIALLHCVSSYPAQAKEMNLATIPDLAKRFGVVPGLSDHTLGITAAVAGVVLGAKVIEKHLTLKRSAGGPDAAFSLEPDEFGALVKAVREAEQAIGKPNYKPTPAELKNIIFKRSLFVVKAVKKGDILTADNIRSIRPGHGLAPKYYRTVINKRALADIEQGTPLAKKHYYGK